MAIFIVRLVLTLALLVLLYQESFSGCLLAAALYLAVFFLARHARRGIRERILNQLADKILFASVLIVLVDLEALSTAFVAWIIGGVFVLSGVDLLERTSADEASDSFFWRSRNLMEMGLAFVLLMGFTFREFLSHALHRWVHDGICYFWSLAMFYWIIRCLCSEKLRKLVREA